MAQTGYPKEKLKIVLLGYLVRNPMGGMAWSPLHYVLGLAAMGHDVLFLEDSDDYPYCYDPSRHVIDEDPTYGLAYAKKAFDHFGLGERWCYYDFPTEQWHGPAADQALDFCRDADLLINVGAANPLREWTKAIPRKALLDLDPLFNQARNLEQPTRAAYAREHDFLFTFGERIPEGRSNAPDDGLPWQATRHPIMLDHWPVHDPHPDGKFTTVLNWDSYPTRTVNGKVYGMKSASFEEYYGLPGMCEAKLELAVGGTDTPYDRLRSHGWQVVNPMEVCGDIFQFRDYIVNSKAEWTVAKHGYVEGELGWFSERTASYMASGRPVVVQGTSCDYLEGADEGVLFFSTPEEATEAIAQVERDYERHCRAARSLAEEFFDSRKVLGHLLERCGSTP